MTKPVVFNPDGNDLKRVMFYYGIEMDDKIVCPFHDDHDPSCHVNFDEGVFHCFACSASGDAFQFVKLANPHLNDLNQLILYYLILKSKKVSKLRLSRINPTKKRENRKEMQAELLETASDYYYGLRSVRWDQEMSEYKTYMLNRGFKSSTLDRFGAKLTITNARYPLIFPIYDMDQFRGYVMRTTNKIIEKDRKYMYNEGFSRLDTLGGRYDNDVVVLCEGYLDRLKLGQLGLKYVAAIFGWKITRQQVDMLKSRGVKTIISALDMDKPGRQGTDYLKNFFDVVEFQFPQGVKDPGDLSEEQFKIAYRKTKSILRSRRKS